MDSDTLYYSLDLVCGNGLIMKLEHRAALQTSLAFLKRNYKFSCVLFWGKILGIKNDYLIALGVGEDELSDKKYLYSFNCIDWHMLPSASESLIAEVAVAASGYFMGDPSHEYEHMETRQQGEGDEAVEVEVMVKVNEEKRLAVTVFTIDKEVAVVPRGAYIKNPHGTVQTNRSFEGLTTSEAAKLRNYLHFSEPRNLKKKTILEMADLNPSIDFLDPLSEDIPKDHGQQAVSWLTGSIRQASTQTSGSWILESEQASGVCTIQNLLWHGLTFFHMPLTPQHGYIYIGHGLKNLDLPFML